MTGKRIAITGRAATLSLAETMRLISDVGVGHPELPALRKRAARIARAHDVEAGFVAGTFYSLLHAGQDLEQIAAWTDGQIARWAKELAAAWEEGTET